MGWKDWSYWLKGGIIGLVISLLITLSTMFMPVYCIGLSQDGTGCVSPTGIDAWKYNFNSLFDDTFGIIILFIVSLFIIGAIIGWIYGKIKQRKR